MIASDENAKQNPNLELAHKVFLIENKLKRSENTDELKGLVLEDVLADSMAAYYTELCEKFGWKVDEVILNKMISDNKSSVVEVDRKILDATENAGDSEVTLTSSVTRCQNNSNFRFISS
jgi:hypothetical protein